LLHPMILLPPTKLHLLRPLLRRWISLRRSCSHQHLKTRCLLTTYQARSSAVSARKRNTNTSAHVATSPIAQSPAPAFTKPSTPPHPLHQQLHPLNPNPSPTPPPHAQAPQPQQASKARSLHSKPPPSSAPSSLTTLTCQNNSWRSTKPCNRPSTPPNEICMRS